MKNLFVLPALAAFFLIAAAAADSVPLTVVVAHPSYLKPVTLTDLVRHQHLREAVIFTLKRARVNVSSEMALPWRQPTCDYIPPERWYAINPGAAVVEFQVQANGSVEVVLHAMAYKRIGSITVPADFGDALPFAEHAVTDLLAALHGPALGSIQFSGTVDADFLADEGRLNLGFTGRIKAQQLLLRGMDNGDVGRAGVHSRLAAHFAMHACYYTRAQELKCHEYFGKALLHAELAAGSNDAAEAALTLRRDIRWLAGRYAAGFQAPPSHTPLLPEVAITTDYESGPPAKNNFSRTASLFVYNVRNEARVFGASENFRFFRRKYDPELKYDHCLIISRDVSFKANAMMDDQVNDNVWQAELRELIVATDGGSQVYPAFQKYLEIGGVNPYELLDNVGTRSRNKSEKGIDLLTLSTLGVLNLIEKELRRGSGASNTFALTFADVFPELVDRATQMILSRRQLQVQLGADEANQMIGQMLTRFGTERVRARRCFSGAPVLVEESIVDWPAFLAEFHSNIVEVSSPALQYHWLRLSADTRAAIEKADFSDEALPAIKRDVLAAANSNERYFTQFLNQNYLNPVSFADDAGRLASHLSSISEAEANIAYRKFRRLMVKEGDYEGAADLLKPFADRYDSSDGNAISYFWCLMRAGKLDEGLDSVCTILNAGFGQSEAANLVLYWKADQFSDAQLKILAAEGNHSAKDYHTRAEYAFRKGDWNEVQDLAKKCIEHYGTSDELYALAALSRICAEPDSIGEEAWKDTDLKIRNQIKNFPATNLMYVVPIVDKHAGTNANWIALKQRLRLEDFAAVYRAELVCFKKSPLGDVRSALDAMRRINRTFTGAGDDEYQLFQRSIRAEHLAFAKRLTLETGGETVTAETLADAVDLIKRTQAYCSAMNISGRFELPLEAKFLADYARIAGPTSTAVTLFTKLPEREKLFKRAGPNFSFFAAYPDALGSWLDSYQLEGQFIEDSRGDPLLTKPNWDEFFQRAFWMGDDALAVKFAEREAVQWQVIDKLAYYGDSEDDAQKWIAANAPTPLLRQIWLESFRRIRPKIQIERETRQRRKPIDSKIPSLLDFIKGTPAQK